MARVSGDLFYGLTMVILGTTVGPVEATVAGHALDYNYNSYKNKRFPPVSKEEIIEQWIRVENEAHDRII